jgi:hypothetical protein
VWPRVPPKRDARLIALDEDRLQSRPGAERAELGDEEQALRFVGKRPEPITELLAHGLNLASLLGPRQPPIQIELRRLVRHVGVRKMGRLIENDLRGREGLARRSLLAILQRLDGFLQPPEIRVEPDRLCVSRLLAPKQVPRTTQLEIAQRDAIARPQVRMMLEHTQPLLGVAIHLVRHQEVAVRPAVAPPHAPPQLVQLRQPELVCPVHDHGVRIRHIEAGLDDHRGHEDVYRALDEACHHFVELRLFESPVRHGDARLWRGERTRPRRDRVDRLDPVVHEIHLARPVKLARERLLDQCVVPGLDEREHGRAILGRGLEQREVPEPREREV